VLKSVYSSIDDVPAELRSHYAERDGKLILQVEGHAERIRELNQESRTHRERAEAAEAKLAAFGDVAPERVAGMADELRASRAFERQALVAAHLTQALVKGRATAEGIDLLSEKLGRRIAVETVDGKRAIRITDDAGKPIEGMTIDAMIADARERWPGAFQGHGGSGGGAPSSHHANAGGRTISRADFDRMSPTTRAARMQTGYTVTD
jgi:hypothetical protein